MSRRAAAPLVLRDYQQEAADRLSAAALDTATKIRAAPTQRRRITKQIGCALLEAPTGSGKTVMLAATAEAVSRGAPVVWFWFAPFAGLIGQTITALREAAPGLRVRDPVKDRLDVGTRPGDVFVATWASVAARRADTRRMRMDDDGAPALDTLVASLRGAGFLLGAVVDEAHHSFRPGTEAFRFFSDVLAPDLLMCATATPNDADVEVLRRGLDIVKFQHVAVSRDRVVAARLNKPRVKAVSFVARGTSAELLDLNDVALRKAVEQHRALKRELVKAGFPLVPLLLVQASSNGWTPAKVKEFLTGSLGFAAESVAVHTADEPDPNVQALANDPAVEVLVFKMAVATGFDAPRAFTLCALRPVIDTSFGLQVIGRIMRVHPLLQPRTDLAPILDTGWVFLSDAQGQTGLQAAADRIKAMRDAISVVTDGVQVFEAAVGEGGNVTLIGADGQARLVLEPPPEVAPRPATPDISRAMPAPAPWPQTLFGRLEETQAPGPVPAGPQPGTPAPRRPTAQAMTFQYPRRAGLVVPDRLRTEKMPRGPNDLLDALIRNVRFTPEQLLAAGQTTASVERQEGDLFERTAQARRVEQAAINELFARQNAHELLRVSQYINPAELGRRLQDRLAAQLSERGLPAVDQKALRRALNIILVQAPNLLRDALRRAAAACTEVVDAADLPTKLESPDPLPPSPLNLYGCMPPGLNTWEQSFADWLDTQDGRVLWWTRNLPRPNAKDDWSVRIVLPETGRGYYPDFVVCVDGRKYRDGIALAETKDRTETTDSAVKSRTEHREYGRALMLSFDSVAHRFNRVEFNAALGRNSEVAPLYPDDLLQ
ncbi:DEAD/DEAH box helicase family protein [Falsiroseomonas sp. CW058]|uniref:DEAD/DEAH box helicase n=1 Tax=Falsiroseomonas sp. CW058 TaxID=3388664 RepID=UPI003D30FECA